MRYVLISVQFSKGIVRWWGLQMQLKNTADITDSFLAPVHRNSLLTVQFFSYLRLLSSAGFYSGVGVGQRAEGHLITFHRWSWIRKERLSHPTRPDLELWLGIKTSKWPWALLYFSNSGSWWIRTEWTIESFRLERTSKVIESNQVQYGPLLNIHPFLPFSTTPIGMSWTETAAPSPVF